MAERNSSGKGDALWRAVTSKVTPLRRRKARSNLPTKQKIWNVVDPIKLSADTTSSVQENSLHRRMTETDVESIKHQQKNSMPLDPDVSPGLDKRSAIRLRRGQLSIDAKLDLHGMTQREAHRALIGFVRGSQGTRRRMVLVITGKGGGGQGVLRAAVPRWLNEASIRPLVLTYAQAHTRDGGGGALYVLLRRKR